MFEIIEFHHQTIFFHRYFGMSQQKNYQPDPGPLASRSVCFFKKIWSQNPLPQGGGRFLGPKWPSSELLAHWQWKSGPSAVSPAFLGLDVGDLECLFKQAPPGFLMNGGAQGWSGPSPRQEEV